MDPKEALQHLQTASRALQQAALDWRVGAVDAPRWADALAELPPAVARGVDALVRGHVQVEPHLAPAVALVAARLRAIWDVAPATVEPCRLWGAARALLEDEDGPQLPAAAALLMALEDTSVDRATTAWKTGRVDLIALCNRGLPEVTGALTGRVVETAQQAAAQDFLRRTQDVYVDALEHAQRRMAGMQQGPSLLLAARTVDSPVLMEAVPTAAARALARALVAALPVAGGALKRLAVKPRALLPGVATVTPAGEPRVGWHERRGVVAALELCELTVTAVLASGMDARLGGTTQLPQTAHALVLALMWPGVMGRVLRLPPSDAERLRRHAAFVLLRQARVAAALAVSSPEVPRAAMDALAQATARDPDVLEAAALMGPWLGTLWEPAPLGVEHQTRFGAWLAAAGTTLGMRAAFDQDAVVRPAFQHVLWDWVRNPQDAKDLGGVLGPPPVDPPAALAGLFVELLG